MIKKSRIEKRRGHWVNKLSRLSGSFADNSSQLIKALGSEIKHEGITALLDHLRICGAVPEQYSHNSSEEKLYSKYTDAVISEAFSAIGMRSTVLYARSDSADVQAYTRDYSLVADAKAFRLSRTAKNQKDFKIQAMDDWRRGVDFAIVVCPIYQLPSRISQIYQQAIIRNVCILSYSHLATLVKLGTKRKTAPVTALKSILDQVSLLHPGKRALDYWTGINRSIIKSLNRDVHLWTKESVN